MDRRRLLVADEASNEGVRALRVLSRRSSYRRLAEKIGRTDSVLWAWLSERRTPNAESRVVLEEKLGIDAALWERSRKP